MRVFIFLQSSNITKNRGGIAMFDFVRKMTLAGAGLAIMTTEKIQEIMDELVKKER